MADERTASRVARYLKRHIAHLEATLATLEAAEWSTPESVNAFARDQARRDAIGAQLDTEQAALLKEWQTAGDATGAERAEVRALAARAGELSALVQRAYDAAGDRATRTAAGVKLRAKTLRWGAGIAQRFGVTQDDSGGYVDRNA